ncbi:MAG: alpha/beta hydrolase [Isosphaeraceae bacterium]
MPLDPKVRELLDQAAALNAAPLNQLSPKRARARMNATSATLGEPEPIAKMIDGGVQSSEGQVIPIRFYDPNPSATAPRPCIVYFHGGGWVTGSIATHDNLCRALANATGSVVASVEYRLAPEHKFPAPVQDAYMAIAGIAQNAPTLRIGELIAAGDSAGGNLAAAATLFARRKGEVRVDRQILIYPILDYHFDTPSYLENADGYLLSRDDMIWFWGHYLADPAEGDNPMASPLRVRDVSNLPPTLIITAEFDPLRDEGNAYAERLMDAKVPTMHLAYEGQIHGFVRRLEQFPQARHAIGEIAEFLRMKAEPVKA